MAKTIKVTWRKSAIGYNKKQKATIAALGFKRLGQTLEVQDSPAVRGMIAKVTHLVTVAEN